jgi:nucleoside-diphosphate-sugar epimerase
MNILLIGGNGFIGKHLHHDLEKDYLVISIDKTTGVNVNSKKDLDRVSINFDHVVFLAAEPNLAAVKANPVEATHTLTTGLINCLERYKHSHFLYFSSSMVYGEWNSHHAMMEYDPKAPKDLYGRLKLTGEALVQTLHDRWTIVRPTAVYGEGDHPNRVLPLFIRTAREGGDIQVKGTDNCLDFTHVSDVVQAVRLIIDNKDQQKFNTNTYNISYGQSYSLDHIAENICNLVGSGTYSMVARDLDYPRRGALNIQKLKHDLGYNPKVKIQDGLKELVRVL